MSSFLENDILKIKPNDDGAREFLTLSHWPKGLQNLFMRSLRIISIRFFIFDDSGSVRTLLLSFKIESPVIFSYIDEYS